MSLPICRGLRQRNYPRFARRTSRRSSDARGWMTTPITPSGVACLPGSMSPHFVERAMWQRSSSRDGPTGDGPGPGTDGGRVRARCRRSGTGHRRRCHAARVPCVLHGVRRRSDWRALDTSPHSVPPPAPIGACPGPQQRRVRNEGPGSRISDGSVMVPSPARHGGPPRTGRAYPGGRSAVGGRPIRWRQLCRPACPRAKAFARSSSCLKRRDVRRWLVLATSRSLT
jgi:hypothetical protein